ncbi:MAG: tRNA (adenosine(37)-N6)-threonylcarbamoyltransferase complex ATPase subunit type 1 TsaE [Patescibacteria group bacterium]
MLSKSLQQTKQIAEDLASQKDKRIFALVGDLGSGKTTFSQFFLRALGVEKKHLTSPTFLIIKSYNILVSNTHSFKRVYHIDCYRLHNSKELLNLKFEEILNNSENILLIEWADKVKDLLPPETVWIYFKHGNLPEEREINVK